MNYFINAIITAVLSFIVATLSYLYQHNRNKLVDSKVKIRILQKLTADAIGISEYLVNSYNAIIKSVENKKSDLGIAPMSPIEAYKYLMDRMLDDTYFAAYATVFRNIIDAESYFFDLKVCAIYLTAQFDLAKETYLASYRSNTELRTNLLADYQKSLKMIQEFMAHGDTKVKNIARMYLATKALEVTKTKPDSDGSGNIDAIDKEYLTPILRFFESVEAEGDLLAYFFLVLEMKHQYLQICFNNEGAAKKLASIVESTIEGIAEMKGVHNILISPEYKMCYMHN
ncbi:MAG: hypothetical protein JSS82_16660 [Bacteroidetes bacterium]|nr:hypothetical protein [Bacteroidota bacterium]